MDKYKKLGKKAPITPATADFYVHEYWPNSRRGMVHAMTIPDYLVLQVIWTVETEAGKMVVANMWFDHETGGHFIRRAISLNTVKWID